MTDHNKLSHNFHLIQQLALPNAATAMGNNATLPSNSVLSGAVSSVSSDSFTSSNTDSSAVHGIFQAIYAEQEHRRHRFDYVIDKTPPSPHYKTRKSSAAGGGVPIRREKECSVRPTVDRSISPLAVNPYSQYVAMAKEMERSGEGSPLLSARHLAASSSLSVKREGSLLVEPDSRGKTVSNERDGVSLTANNSELSEISAILQKNARQYWTGRLEAGEEDDCDRDRDHDDDDDDENYPEQKRRVTSSYLDSSANLLQQTPPVKVKLQFDLTPEKSVVSSLLSSLSAVKTPNAAVVRSSLSGQGSPVVTHCTSDYSSNRQVSIPRHEPENGGRRQRPEYALLEEVEREHRMSCRLHPTTDPLTPRASQENGKLAGKSLCNGRETRLYEDIDDVIIVNPEVPIMQDDAAAGDVFRRLYEEEDEEEEEDLVTGDNRMAAFPLREPRERLLSTTPKARGSSAKKSKSPQHSYSSPQLLKPMMDRQEGDTSLSRRSTGKKKMAESSAVETLEAMEPQEIQQQNEKSASFTTFLERQRCFSEARKKKLEDVKREVTPSFHPITTPRSAVLKDRLLERTLQQHSQLSLPTSVREAVEEEASEEYEVTIDIEEEEGCVNLEQEHWKDKEDSVNHRINSSAGSSDVCHATLTEASALRSSVVGGEQVTTPRGSTTPEPDRDLLSAAMERHHHLHLPLSYEVLPAAKAMKDNYQHRSNSNNNNRKRNTNQPACVPVKKNPIINNNNRNLARPTTGVRLDLYAPGPARHADPLDAGCTFRPMITPAAKRLAARPRHCESLYEEHRRRDRMQQEAKKRAEEEELRGLTFEPKLNPNRGATSALKVGNFAKYEAIRKRKEAYIQQQREALQRERERKEMEECTFRPQLSKTPSYLSRMASEYNTLERRASSYSRMNSSASDHGYAVPVI